MIFRVALCTSVCYRNGMVNAKFGKVQANGMKFKIY